MNGDANGGGDPTDPCHGHLDRWDGLSISGWAWDAKAPSRRLEIEVLHEGICVLVLKANRHRPDLKKIGMGDGCYGFEGTRPSAVSNVPHARLHFRIRKTGQELVGSPAVAGSAPPRADQPDLRALGIEINAAIRNAGTADELATLQTWLMQHHDRVFQRQTELTRLALQREIWLEDIRARPETAAKVLDEIARITPSRYPALSLPSLDEPQVSIVIPAFNQFAYTYRCVRSILEHGARASFEVIVADDASTDETVFAGQVFQDGIRVLRNPRNLGFLHTVNAASRVASGRLLCLLNNDTEVQPGWLDALVDTFARDPAIGIAGAKLISPNGLLQEAGGVVFQDGAALNWGRGENPDDPRFGFLRDTDYVSGAALMIERALFDAVGALSAEFAPAYYEDTDLCFKVRQAGRRVVVQPQARVLHHEGITCGTDMGSTQVKRYQFVHRETFRNKWATILRRHGRSDGGVPTEIERGVTRRALVIDETVPTPDQDAGSNAILSHMLALQRIGYQVSFAPENMQQLPPYTGQLEARGIRCYHNPFADTVRDVISHPAARFDLFYVHRVSNMQRYAALIRKRFPQAHIVYNVADLHHLRLKREAALLRDAAIRLEAGRLKRTELAMAQAADSVIVHSTFERALLQKTLPGAAVHAVPWTVAPQPATAPFATRRGLAFIGGYNHTPNVDAAVWLAEVIMPLVHAAEPAIECLLIGSQMPDRVRALERPGVRALGHIEDLWPTLSQLRLTAAPLRYGAGMKGKVLTSFALGLPCVATTCAVEGMGLPAAFDPLIADTAEELAARIVLAHRDPTLNARLAQAGLGYVSRTCAPEAVEEALRRAIAPAARGGRRARRGAGPGTSGPAARGDLAAGPRRRGEGDGP